MKLLCSERLKSDVSLIFLDVEEVDFVVAVDVEFIVPEFSLEFTGIKILLNN